MPIARRRLLSERKASNTDLSVKSSPGLEARANGDVDDFGNRTWPYSTDYVTPVTTLHGVSATKIAEEAALTIGVVLTSGFAAAAPLLIADAIQILAGKPNGCVST